MVFKKGVNDLKKYLENESKEYKKIDKELGEKWHERNFMDRMQQAVLNQRFTNIRILEDILQELETDDLKLQVTFSGPTATDLPNLDKEPFNEEGIKLEYKGGLIRESVEAPQLAYWAFWIIPSISLISSAITIGKFIHNRLQKSKNTKVWIGPNEVDSSTSQDDMQKIFEKELKRIKDEIENLKNDYEKED